MRQFPIFLDLDGTLPLVVGGSDLAFAKVRLILKRASRILLAADILVEGLQALVAQNAIDLIPEAQAIDHLAGRPLIIAASADEAYNARISHAARALGVPVNVPDKPDLCTFALAAIVDRDPLTIAIGTSGQAPVLATQLRARLEAEVHPRLGLLAAWAGELRDDVAKVLTTPSARRAFWDRVFSGPAARAYLAGDELEARALVQAELAGATLRKKKARVILMGAGPGDPDLLTFKAVRALKSADVILFDRLIGERILEHARREARIINVGKSKGCPSLTQAQINDLLLEHARDGQTVVRVKGGDPFMFGRGGEEVEVLRQAGIDVEVIPGITAAAAAAASTQISLTHRDLSRTVTFLSGHGPGNGELDLTHIDLEALNSGQHTLAVYMAVSSGGALGHVLLKAGWQPSTPVLAVENVSRLNERRVLGSLYSLAQGTIRASLKGPAVLLIGEVAGQPIAGEVEHVTDVVLSCLPAGSAVMPSKVMSDV